MNKKYFSRALAVAVITGFTIIKSNQPVKYIDEFKTYKVQNTENKYNADIIIHLINNNPNLSIEDKAFLSSFKDFYNDKSEYFNMETVIPALKELRIEYTGDVNRLTLGSYSVQEKLIKINNYNQYTPEINDVLFHEFIHALTIFKDIESVDKYLYEGFTEQVNIDYNDVENPNYKLLRSYVKELKIILGEDILNEYFYSNNMDIIVKELAKITGSKKQARELLQAMRNHYFYGQKCYARGEAENEAKATTLLKEYHAKKNK